MQTIFMSEAPRSIPVRTGIHIVVVQEKTWCHASNGGGRSKGKGMSELGQRIVRIHLVRVVVGIGGKHTPATIRYVVSCDSPIWSARIDGASLGTISKSAIAVHIHICIE